MRRAHQAPLPLRGSGAARVLHQSASLPGSGRQQYGPRRRYAAAVRLPVGGVHRTSRTECARRRQPARHLSAAREPRLNGHQLGYAATRRFDAGIPRRARRQSATTRAAGVAPASARHEPDPRPAGGSATL